MKARGHQGIASIIDIQIRDASIGADVDVSLGFSQILQGRKSGAGYVAVMWDQQRRTEKTSNQLNSSLYCARNYL